MTTLENKPLDFVVELMSEPADAVVIAALVAELAPIEPAAATRRALMQAIATTEAHGRLYRFAEAIAAMVDVTIDKARELLDQVADASRWEKNLFPGMDALWVGGGPRAAQCIRGFARLASGAEFPHHEHLGDEATLVLEGVMLESGGAVVRPGETSVARAGTQHHYRAAPGRADLLFFVVAREGIGIGDVTLRHRDGEDGAAAG